MAYFVIQPAITLNISQYKKDNMACGDCVSNTNQPHRKFALCMKIQV